jgi:tRNA A-37 threonylcarbamoyl transferase component Bud32
MNDISFLIDRIGHAILDLANSNIYHDDITPDNILIYRNDCLLQYDFVLVGLDSLSYGY